MYKNQGYYSLIQYSERPERFEYINIGIVLFSSHHPRLNFMFADNPNRIEEFFACNLDGYFADVVTSIGNRLLSEFSKDWDKKTIDKFASMRSGKIHMTPPKSCLVENSNIALEELFSQLVDVSGPSSEMKPNV